MLLNESPYLNARGRALWDRLTERDVSPTDEVLILQACRLVDTLDRLDAAKRSRQVWIELAAEAEDEYPDTKKIKIVVDGLLSEYRQQAIALSTILAKLSIEPIVPPSASANRIAERRTKMREQYEQLLSGAELGTAPDTLEPR